MPGPRMGPRPRDFDEEVVRQAPTFLKWQQLQKGQTLRYACRTFEKGIPDDEERLMRRIMIARRNNIRDHEVLKRARTLVVPDATTAAATASLIVAQQQQQQQQLAVTAAAVAPIAPIELITAAAGGVDKIMDLQGGADMSTTTSSLDDASAPTNGKRPGVSHSSSSSRPNKKRRPAHTYTDQQIEDEMDVVAVEATRSFRSWMALSNGQEFVYNQKYVKGKEGHDWLLKKNIWRRMRYRRENKKIVDRFKVEKKTLEPFAVHANHAQHHNHQQHDDARLSAASAASQIVDHALVLPPASATNKRHHPQVAIKLESSSLDDGLEDGSREGLMLPDDTVVDAATAAAAAAAAAAAVAEHQHLTGTDHPDDFYEAAVAAAAQAERKDTTDFVNKDVVEAAVAAAENYYVKSTAAEAVSSQQQQHHSHTNTPTVSSSTLTAVQDSQDHENQVVAAAVAAAAAAVAATDLPVGVHNPLEAATIADCVALDAAAQLAAAAVAADTDASMDGIKEEEVCGIDFM